MISLYRKGLYMDEEKRIIRVILNYYPGTQAIYLFGSFDTEDERADSDVDIAPLFHPPAAQTIGALAMSELRFELEAELNKTVDIVNLRLVSTVFQKEIVTSGRLIYQGDTYAVDEFEMLVLSFLPEVERGTRGDCTCRSVGREIP